MKKLLIVTLVLATLFTCAMPAMAYTQRKAGTAGSQYTVDLQLVEYDSQGGIFPGMISQKPVNRAYAKNEIVAAVGSIIVPAYENVFLDGYTEMQFTSKNVSFGVTENRNGAGYDLMTTVPAANWGLNNWKLEDEDTTLRMELDNPIAPVKPNQIPVNSSKKTYRWLVFGKVIKDGAKLSLEFVKQAKFAPVVAGAWTTAAPFGAGSESAARYLVISEDYVVFKQTNNNYIVYEIPGKGGYNPAAAPTGDPLFRIEVGKRNATERLYMYTGKVTGPLYRIFVEPSSKELIFVCIANVPRKTNGDQIQIGTSGYKTLRATYDEHFEKGLGLSAYYEGNILLDKDWETLASKMSLSASVELTPWVPYPTR